MTVERIQSPYGGINSEAAPDYLPATKAPILDNLLPGKPGRVSLRAGMTSATQVADAGPADLIAMWHWEDDLLVQANHSAAPTTFHLTPTGVPDSYSVATITPTNPPWDNAHARFGSYVYGKGAVSVGIHQTGIIKWDGTDLGFTVMTDAPHDFLDATVHQHRLFVLGGTKPVAGGPVAFEPKYDRALYYTNPFTDEQVDTADLGDVTNWTDPATGLVNMILVDGDDDLVGIASCGRWLAVIGTRSVTVLTGSGNTDYALRPLANTVGVISGRDGIASADSGVYFLTDHGLAYCDGGTVSVVSDDIQLPFKLSANPAMTWIDGGYLMVTDQSWVRAYMFHTAARAWCGFTAELGLPTYATRTKRFTIVWIGGYACIATRISVPANDFTDPTNGIDYRGVDFIGWPNEANIPWRLRTRLARLAGPTNMAQVNRVLLDYVFSISIDGSRTALNINQLRVSVSDVEFTALASDIAASTLADPSRGRFQLQTALEKDAVAIEVTNAITGSSPAHIEYLDLYDLAIEFEPGRPRPTI